VWHSNSFVLFYLADSRRLVAFVASKKVGKAVKRNRARRVLKALFLEHIEHHRDGYYVLVAKVALLDREFSLLKKEYRRSLIKSGLFKK
jgi:ribonuclease P protein component